MKYLLIALLILAAPVLNAQNIEIRRGAGSGSGTATFTNLTSAAGGQSLIKSNDGTNVVMYSLTNGTANVAVTTNANSIIISVTVVTNDVSEFTNSFAINTVQTNTTTNILFSVNSLLLAPSTTEGAKASLVVETAASSGTFQQIAEIGEMGVVGVFNITNDVVGFVSPGARFYVTNQSIGGAAASIISGYRQYLIGGLSSGNNNITITSTSLTVTGSPGTTFTIETPWSTNLFTDTNMFRLATNQMISQFTTYTNLAVDTNMFRSATNLLIDTNTFRLMTNLYVDTNMFRLATNQMVAQFTVFTNLAVDTNMFRLATNQMVSQFTTFTNIAVDTNMFRQATNSFDMTGVVDLSYAGAGLGVVIVDWNLGFTFRLNVASNTTLIHSNIATSTNFSRSRMVWLRQNATGTFAVGTLTTNGVVAGGRTNLVMNTNANQITVSAWASSVFTNGMAWGSVITNSY